MLLLGYLVYLGKVDIYTLTALSLMQGVLDGAHMPVRMSVVPNLVTRQQLQSAIAITSISFNVSRFVGPAIAGIIIVKFGIAQYLKVLLLYQSSSFILSIPPHMVVLFVMVIVAL